MKKNLLKIISIIIIIIIVIFVIVILKNSTRQKTHYTLTKINVQTPQIKNLIQKLEVTGKVIPYKTNDIYVGAPLRVNKVYVAKGDLVKKGELLISYDPQTRIDLQNKIQTAQLSLKSSKMTLNSSKLKLKTSKIQYETNQKIYKLGGISLNALQESKNTYQSSNISYLEQQAKIKSLELKIKSDKANLSRTITETRSEYDGVVTDIVAQPNYVVSMQNPKPLLKIAVLSKLKISASISEYNINKIRVGQKAKITSEVSPLPTYGKITRISAIANNGSSQNVQNTSVPITLTFKNIKDLLKPNYTVNISVITASKKNVLTIPSIAITVGAKGSYVYILNSKNIVVKKYIKTGMTATMSTQIIGLSKNSRVITTVSSQIHPGMKILKNNIIFIDYSKSVSKLKKIPGVLKK